MKHSKWIMALGSAALLLGTFPQAYAADQPVQVGVYFTPMHFDFDGKGMTPPEGQRSFLYENTTYVPLRFVSYALNKSVAWDAETYTVTVSEPKNAGERTTIEEYNLNRVVQNAERKAIDPNAIPLSSIDVYKSQVQYVFDGAKKKPSEEQPGLLYKDTLYVPIRFLSESVGKEIGFDPVTYTVKASTKKVVPAATATPKPTATPTVSASPSPTPVSGGGGGGGGSAAKPTYDALIQAAESQISSLKSTAQGNLTEMLNEYKSASTQEEKNRIMAEGLAAIQNYDSQFESILSDLSSKLSSNGYNTDVLNDYRERYKQEKEAQQEARK